MGVRDPSHVYRWYGSQWARVSQRTNTTSTVVDAELSEDDDPSWDTSEAERGPWLYDLEEWLPRIDAEYETLIEEGTCTNHYKTAVVSADHAEIIKQVRSSSCLTFFSHKSSLMHVFIDLIVFFITGIHKKKSVAE